MDDDVQMPRKRPAMSSVSPGRFNWTPIETRSSITTPRCFQRGSPGLARVTVTISCAATAEFFPGRKPFPLADVSPGVGRPVLSLSPFLLSSPRYPSTPRRDPQEDQCAAFLRRYHRRDVPHQRKALSWNSPSPRGGLPFAARPFTSARYPSRGGPTIVCRYENSRSSGFKRGRSRPTFRKKGDSKSGLGGDDVGGWRNAAFPTRAPRPSTTAVTTLGLRLSLCTRGVSGTTPCHRRVPLFLGSRERERGISSPRLRSRSSSRSLGPCGLGRLRVCYLAGCTVN